MSTDEIDRAALLEAVTTLQVPPEGKPWGEGALVIALGPTLFDVDDLAARCRSYLARFADRPGPGRREGTQPGRVVLPTSVWNELAAAAERYAVALPEPTR